ncbi:hypothetical protein B0H16DRAFT_1881849 [Mycena metata]|uniref:Chromo domain-containing protein n=1 Tax=Mycena metata TaxID=1033252 RepID=A0AAD7NPH9_9AGAR|nr:hypothetical protein B0H16DRAFT_1881849 [Mycena metata]
MSEELFYVERIVEARVDVKGEGRKSKKFWSYLTVWDGYGPTDWTWEPKEAFQGNQYAIQTFWRDADYGNRNPEQLSRFKPNEKVKLKTSVTGKPKSKPGPGRSSAGMVMGSRVFALHAEDHHYYSGVVQRRSGLNYVVRFDEDDTEVTVPLKHLRLCAKLRCKDTVILKADNVEVVGIEEDGRITVQKVADYSSVKISAYNVEHEWRDREPSDEEIHCQSRVKTYSRRN